MKHKLLTIIIPTFNRKKEVLENLDYLLPIVSRYREKVNIYISDNASTDGTEEALQPFIEANPDLLFYFRQPKNITASPNFNHAVHSVDSEYVYILGDDDLILPEFLSTVFSLMDRYPEVGIFHFNYVVSDGLLGNCFLHYSTIGIHHENYYTSGAEFIRAHFASPSFVSSNLFKRELWIANSSRMKEDCPGYVWFSILMFACLQTSCLYYSVPLLIQRMPATANYSRNWPLYYIKGLGRLFKYLDEDVPGIYEQWRTAQQIKDKRHLWIHMIGVAQHKKYYQGLAGEVVPFLIQKSSRIYYYMLAYCIPAFVAKGVLKKVLLMAKFLKKR